MELGEDVKDEVSEQEGTWRLERLTSDSEVAARDLVRGQWGHDEVLRVFGKEGNPGCIADEGLPAHFVMVDELSEVVAHAKLLCSDDKAVVQSVVVDPRRRRSGIGTRLMSMLATEAKRAKLSSIYLRTPDMAPFYESCGFQKTTDGRGPYQWSKPCPARKGEWLSRRLAQ